MKHAHHSCYAVCIFPQFVHVYINFILPLMTEAQHTKTTQHLQWPSHTKSRQNSIVTVTTCVVWKQLYSGDHTAQTS